MEQPLVSIVAPSHNHSRYIEACLDSLLFQDYPHLEIIIVDDCSTDNSREVIKKYLSNVESEMVSYASFYNAQNDEIERTQHKRYPASGRKLVYLENPENLGSTATYNRGLQAASGEFCTFMATDDLAHPQFISSMVDALQEAGADFAYADMFIIDDQHRILREFKLPEFSIQRCFSDWYLCGVATLYRRELHERFGWYDECSYADDHECYLRFALSGARFVHVKKTLYSVRSHHERECGLHAPERYKKLLEASKRLTLKARAEEANF